MRRKWIVLAVVCALLALGLEMVLLGMGQKNAEGVSAYMLNKPCEAGKPIEKAQLTQIKLPNDNAHKIVINKLEEIVGKKSSRALDAGKVLTTSDFENSEADEIRQSMVVKLNPEQSHRSELAAGEEIVLLCYRQGAIEKVEHVIVKAVGYPEGVISGDAQTYVTVEGTSKALETLFLAEQEGVICIVKKTAVQMP